MLIRDGGCVLTAEYARMEFALIIPEGYEVIIKRAESTLLGPHNVTSTLSGTGTAAQSDAGRELPPQFPRSPECIISCRGLGCSFP
jgi:hypothetical protein